MYKVKVISHLFTNIRGNIRLATTLADTLYNFYLNKFGTFYCVHRNKPDWWMFHANFSYLMKQFVLEVLSMSLIDMYIMLHSYNDDKLMINSYNKVFKKSRSGMTYNFMLVFAFVEDVCHKKYCYILFSWIV